MRKKSELRQIVRHNYKQQHFWENREAWQSNAVAASGATWRARQRLERNAGRMLQALDFDCEPILPAQALVEGIAHRTLASKKVDVARALASKKVHYITKLQGAVRGGRGDAASGAPFCEAYPDAVLRDGWAPLTGEAFENAKAAAKIRTDDDYVKHILDKHDGEVRHWGPRWRTRATTSGSRGRPGGKQAKTTSGIRWCSINAVTG